MKKRILCVSLIAALIVSAAGCGEKAPAETTAKTETTTAATETVNETTAKEAATDENLTEETTTAETTTEATTEAPPKEVEKIKDYKLFQHGCLVFDINNDYHVYNAVDNKMYELSGDITARDIDYINGKIITTGTYNDEIYNIETGETYDFKPAGDKMLGLKSIPVYKVEESFDGDTLYFGIIDNNGEWVLPLSADYAVCKTDHFDISSNSVSVVGENDSYLFIDYGLSLDYGEIYAYDYKNDKLLSAGDLNCGEIIYPDSKYEYAPGNNLLLYKIGGKSNIGLYNTQTGETQIFDEKYSNGYPKIWNHTEIFATFNSDHNNNGVYQITVFNSNGDMLDFDLSEYSVETIYDATEDYILFSAVNPNGNRYTLIMDKNGKSIVDPIKGADIYRSHEKYRAYIRGDYAICLLSSGGGYIVNCKTGEIKTYSDDNLSIEAFDKDSGMLLMKSDGAYYLADPSDPDTLLNPFELVQN